MLLALDTATATASVAIYDLAERQLLAEVTWQARRRQTQQLLVAARQLLAQCDRSPSSIAALAVTTGPGSFTGVRIGISTVKGIALGLPHPPRVLGVPTLSVTAAPWLDIARGGRPAAAICVVIQAGRGKYNWAFFADGNLLHRPAVADHRAGDANDLAADLAARADQPVWLAGEVGAELAVAVAPYAHVTVIDSVSSLRRAGQLARLAARHFDNGHADALQELQPLYLRAP